MNLRAQPKQIIIFLNCPKIIVWKNDFVYRQIFIPLLGGILVWIDRSIGNM